MKAANDHVSASEMSKSACLRAWAARYRSDWRASGSTAHFASGTRLHKYVEDYLRFGKGPTDLSDPLTEMFVECIPYLPKPKSFGMRLEEKSTFYYRQTPYQVKPDVVLLNKVIDIKTSKDPRTYGIKTWEAKLGDPQTILYAFKHLPQGGVFEHVYLAKTKALCRMEAIAAGKDPEFAGGSSKPRTCVYAVHLERYEIELAMEELHAFGSRVYKLRNKFSSIRPETVAGDFTMCGEYGRCEYQSTCHPTGWYGVDEPGEVYDTGPISR